MKTDAGLTSLAEAPGRECGGYSAGSIMMFAGKGGVGKTTCAATTALHHASLGKRTLALSTDATPSLSHVFEVAGKSRPAIVDGSLHIREVGLAEIREMWDRKFGREVYAVFSSFVSIQYEYFVEFMTSILPGLGEEFMVDYIRELKRSGEYETVVWDTAPLGETLALLKTPSLLVKHLRMAPRIYSKLRVGRGSREPVLDILRRWEKLSAENMAFLRNEVRFNLVTIAEALAVEQLDSVFSQLNEYGLKVEQIIVNNVVKADGSSFLKTRAEQQRRYLDTIHEKYSHLRIVELPMFPYEMKGVTRLRELGKALWSSSPNVLRQIKLLPKRSLLRHNYGYQG